MRPIHIFNHLDITVIVHETEASQRLGSFKGGGSTTTVSFAGQTFEVSVPERAVRIVGFEVTPRSVPYGLACTETEDREILLDEDGEPEDMCPLEIYGG